MLPRLRVFKAVSGLHDETVVKELVKKFTDQLQRNGIATRVHELDSVKDYVRRDPIPFAILVATGGTEKLVMDAVKDLKTPILLIAHFAQNSLPAALEIVARLQQLKLRGMIALMPEAQDKCYEIRKYIRFLSVLRKMDRCKIGVLGGPSDWLVASSPKDDVVKDAWGPQIVTVPMTDLFAGIKRVPPSEYKLRGKEFRQMANHSDEVSDVDIEKSAQVYSAMSKLLRDRKLNSVTIRCFDLISELKSTACLAVSRLISEGHMAGCEGDVPALLSMMILHYLATTLDIMQPFSSGFFSKSHQHDHRRNASDVSPRVPPVASSSGSNAISPSGGASPVYSLSAPSPDAAKRFGADSGPEPHTLPFMANPVELSVRENTLVLAHCTIASSLCETVTLKSHFESGLGVGVSGVLAIGRNAAPLQERNKSSHSSFGHPLHTVTSAVDVRDQSPSPSGVVLPIPEGEPKENVREAVSEEVGRALPSTKDLDIESPARTSTSDFSRRFGNVMSQTSAGSFAHLVQSMTSFAALPYGSSSGAAPNASPMDGRAVTLLRIGGTGLQDIWVAEGEVLSGCIGCPGACREDQCRTQIKIKLVNGNTVGDLLSKPLGNHICLIPGELRDDVLEFHSIVFGTPLVQTGIIADALDELSKRTSMTHLEAPSLGEMDEIKRRSRRRYGSVSGW